jgi:hypothetical protein
MARRQGPPTYGKRYVGNTNTAEVHDLNNEKIRENQCQIDEIITANHAVTFTPDSLAQAHSTGYDNCAHCLVGSSR